jgi:hypothetical protein
MLSAVTLAFTSVYLTQSAVVICTSVATARWAKQLGGPDAWNAACLYSNNKEACPDLNRWDAAAAAAHIK